VIMPISGVHNGTLAALHFARSLSDDITVLHVSIDPIETSKVKAKWEIWGEGCRLVVLDSPYRLFLEPLLEYIDKISAILAPNEISPWWYRNSYQNTGGPVFCICARLILCAKHY